MLRKLFLALAAVVVTVAGLSYVGWKRMAGAIKSVPEIFADQPETPSAQERVRRTIDEARKSIASLGGRAHEIEAKGRELQIKAEERRIKKDRHARCEAEMNAMVHGFVSAAKAARGAGRDEFRYNGRRYKAEDAEHQVKQWCAALKKCRDHVAREDKASAMYCDAAARMEHQRGVLDEARGTLGAKVDELETQEDLLIVEAEIRALTNTANGFHEGEVGKAIAALESEVDTLLATVQVDSKSDSPVITVEQALAEMADASEDESVRDLARIFWSD